MQVVILCGGKGTRLRPLTYKVPKPMLKIHGMPFLQYQIELMKEFGLNKFLLLTGYLGQQIRSYFKNGESLGVNIDYSIEKEPLGTGGALKNAEKLLSDEFILLNGDTYLNINYMDLIKYFEDNNREAIITIYDNKDKYFKNNILIDEQHIVIGYNKKDDSMMTHIDAGAFVIRKSLLKHIPAKSYCSMEEEIFNKLIETKQLKAFITSNRFYDIGSFKELLKIETVITNKNKNIYS